MTAFDQPVSRRQLLKGGGAAAVTGLLAGCSSLPGTGGGKSYEKLPSPYLGAKDSDVVVEVWEDFACPHCAEYNNTVVPKLYQKYIKSNDIKYVHHDFPLPINKWSWNVAYVARNIQATAGRETFWVFTKNAFANHNQYSKKTLEKIAEKMNNVPTSIVGDSLKNQAYRSTIKQDKAKGAKKGVSGTPAVFVNGKEVQPTFGNLVAAIDEAKAQQG